MMLNTNDDVTMSMMMLTDGKEDYDDGDDDER